MWQNKTRPNKTARLPYAYIPSEDDPLVLIPDPEVVRLVEDALDHLDQGHSSRRVAAWLGEKTGQKISPQGITNIWKEHRGPNSDKPSRLLKEREKARKKAAPKGRAAKKIAATKRKQSDAKRVLTMSSKKLAKLEGTDAKPKTVTDDLDFNAVQQVAQNQTVVFEPLPGPVLFGGVAGGSALSQTSSDILVTETLTVCFCGEPMTSCGKSCGRHRSYTRKRTRERNGRRRRDNGRSRLVLDFGSLTWRDRKTF